MNKKESNKLLEKKTAAIYCRVSTEEQASKDENSLEVQEATLKKYCADQGLLVNADYIYVDRGISGKSLNRPEIQRLREDASKGKFQCVVTTKLDRLSRSVKDFLDLDYELQKLQIDIKVQSQNFDTTTPSGKMLRMMLMAFAEFERDMISERTTDSMKYLFEQGFPRSGVQLGYDRVGKLWLVNEEEAKLVNKIFELYLHNPSTSTVANILNEGGYRTKERISKKDKVLGGQKFSRNNIVQILTNPEYLGKVKRKDVIRDGKHEAIISEETFNLVQEQIKRSQRTEKFATKKRAIPLTLNEILYCGFCGTRMTPAYGKKKGEKYYYYQCTNKMHNTTTACPGKNLGATQLENFINTIFEVLATDERTFEQNFSLISNGKEPKIKEFSKQHERLLAALARASGQLKNLTKALSVKGIEKTPQTIIDEIAVQESTIKALEEQIESVDARRARLKKENYDKETFRRAFINHVSMVKNYPPEKRKGIYNAFFESITSKVDAKSKNGEIIVKVNTDGDFVRMWADLKKFELSEVESSNLRLEVYPGEDLNLRPTV